MAKAGALPKLMNPRSSAARAALGRTCPMCQANPGQWCVGRKGKQLTRIHYARCEFKVPQ